MTGEVAVSPDIFEIPVVVDGEEHRIRPGGWPASFPAKWRTQFGKDPRLGVAVDTALVYGALDYDHVAGLWWLHRVAEGETDLTFDQVDFDYHDAKATQFAQQNMISERARAAKTRRQERERARGKAGRASSNGANQTPTDGS